MKRPNLVNAAKSACRVVRAAVNGEAILLDEGTVKERLQICKGEAGNPKCPFYSKGQCLACTCFVELKAQLATEKCPKGKWPVTNA